GTRTKPQLAEAAPIDVEWEGQQPMLPYGWLRPSDKELLTQWRTTPVVTDWNGDKLVDLVMLDQQGYLAFFERALKEGRRVLSGPRRVFVGENFSVTDQRHNVVDSSAGLIRLNRGSAGRSGRRKLCAADWDGDGRLDLLVNSSNANFLRQTSAGNGRWTFRDMGP